ncbi:hypothetical protein N8944_01745 [Pseudomonadales bacterium]|nr:hypothetical protein [Pseudomonadales bacterium]
MNLQSITGSTDVSVVANEFTPTPQPSPMYLPHQYGSVHDWDTAYKKRLAEKIEERTEELVIKSC